MKYLPLILGLLCSIGALYQFYRGSWLFLNGQSVEGRVVGNERSLGKSSVYYPIVEFQTLGGQTYRCKGQSGTSPAEYEVNDTVTVHFDPAKPTNTFIGNFFSLIQGALFSMGLGVLFSWFGLKVLGWGKPQASIRRN
ncbi:DUF3592 domain-containing protein [Spirosoma radiotolerans]|uniref:DUF3592 domain-containing protein n=1 Tax=Spirosoma radiotolerans TaxID=1379870 RepID=UPI0006974B26|nr:DUF3592 domain-containing protein [Spirosoma radiotolerans]